MPETSIPTPSGFNELSKAEQVRYLQALWDQISEHPAEIPVPESHLQLAEDRLRHYRENPSEARSAFDVIDRLSEKSKGNNIDSKVLPPSSLMSKRPSIGTNAKRQVWVLNS